MHDERTRWNERYNAGSHFSAEPSTLLTSLDSWLPRTGRALDVAGGAGRHAIWLASRGLDVTLADISDVALKVAASRAAAAELLLSTLQIDLEHEAFPLGPWDLVVIVHYLWRPLFRVIPATLNPNGIFVCIQPTMSNLERHPKPPAKFLLEDGEIPKLVAEMQTLYYQEDWLSEGRHEAVLIAERRS